jgi:hypothetical protein
MKIAVLALAAAAVAATFAAYLQPAMAIEFANLILCG